MNKVADFKMSHTKEPWHVGGREKSTIYDEFNQRIANSFEGVMATQRTDSECAANARRIVACINACAGIETEALESTKTGELCELVTWKIRQVEKQRDELLDALEELMTCKHGEFCDHYPAAYKKALAAIASVKGGAA